MMEAVGAGGIDWAVVNWLESGREAAEEGWGGLGGGAW